MINKKVHTAQLKVLWETCFIRENKKAIVQKTVDKIKNQRQVYEAISRRTGVPWYIIGCIHNMESSCRPNTYLHNGDPMFDSNGNPLSTVHVPAGVGPFSPHTFEEAAVDALKRDRFSGVNKNTPIEEYLYLLEGFNGYGYASRNINSPYLWSFTNQYGDAPNIGLYVADHQFDESAISKQVGCAAVLKLLLANENYELPPSNPHLWDASIFFRKMDEYFTSAMTTHEKYLDLQKVWPQARLKIEELLKRG